MSQCVLVCPHCRKKIGNYDSDADLDGSPLKTCPKCQELYIDKQFHEIAVEGIRDEDISTDPEFLSQKRKSALLTILGGIGVMVAFFVILALGWIYYFLPIISIVMVIGGFKTLGETSVRKIEKKRRMLENERALSLQRMQNPQYVENLRRLGYIM